MRRLLLASAAMAVCAVATLGACVSDSNTGLPVVDSGTDGAAPLDSGAIGPDSGVVDALADAGPGPGPLTGDVVYLEGSRIDANASNALNTWPGTGGLGSFSPTGGKPPSVLTYSDLGSAPTRCANFTVGSSSLIGKASTTIDLTTDFTVTLKLVRGAEAGLRDDGIIPFSKVKLREDGRSYRGFAFLSDYHDMNSFEKSRKFAGRYDYDNGVQAKDVVEPAVRTGLDQRFVVAFRRHGAEGTLFVRAAGDPVADVTTGTPFGTAESPTDAPILIGSDRPDADDTTKFDGLLCNVIVHVGPETNDQIQARIESLKW